MSEKRHALKCKTEDKIISAGHFIQRGCDCDGFHTFNELYLHRAILYISLCKSLMDNSFIGTVWRSKLHSDGYQYKGWFLLGIGEKKGKMITYHIPMSRWEETDFAETYDVAPEFDGHTSDDVLERLKDIII